MEKRLPYIDMLKALGIFLMILCHTGLENRFTQWTYAFHMPLFFIASGILTSSSKDNLIDFVSKKAIQLLIPYLSFSLILCFGTHTYFDWGYIFYGSRNALAEASSFTPLWFLPCFFVSTIITQIVYKVSKEKIWAFFIISIVIGCSGFFLSRISLERMSLGFPCSLDVAMVGVLLIALGKCMKPLRWGGYLVVPGSFLPFRNLPPSLSEGNPHVEMSIAHYGNELLFIVNATIMTLGLLSIFHNIQDYRLTRRYIIPCTTWVGKNSLSILCLHGIVINIVTKCLKIGGIVWGSNLLITIITLAICFPIVQIVKKNMPNLLGIK